LFSILFTKFEDFFSTATTINASVELCKAYLI
jgi:hypothetical protein